MSEKYSLVLEGGGMRGAYTAGALAWLNDHNITFDYSVGISSGAVFLTCFLMRNKEIPHNMSVYYAADKENVGLRAFLREGHYVAYRHLFDDDLKKKEGFNVALLKKENPNCEFGVYDLDLGKTVWYGPQDIDDDCELLLATCALPIASAVVHWKGKRLLDGGVTKMIPIERAIEKGATKHLVITTKPEGYVRKKGSKMVELLMRLCYPKDKQIREDYKIRHINYYKQMGIIEELQKTNDALLIRPSKTIPISRFKGDPKNLKKLYELGYNDMEERKEEILTFLKKQ